MRVAIYGGSFDPIHRGHVAVAEAAKKRFDLDEVLLIPTAHPPHRDEPHASYEDRYEMVRLALEGRTGLLPSRLEEPGSAEKHYTIDTIRKLRAQQPNAELFVIIGADSYNNIHTWREPQAIVSEAELIVVSRPGCELNAKMRLPASRVHFIQDVEEDVSASRLRAEIASDANWEEFVPRAVAEYIREHHLYV
jgi:nicotinate-nucleotide adenylyltransferase